MLSDVTRVGSAVAGSVDELLAGASARAPFVTTDSKSGAGFERVVIDGERFVVKYLHVDDDWIMRQCGDLRCFPLQVWRSGLLDRVPACIDPAIVGAAEGVGRHGWGAALLMRDVSAHLVPPGDDPVPPAQHLAFLDHLAGLSAAFWGWRDDVGLLPFAHRWYWFGDAVLTCEAARGWPDEVPVVAAEGWARFVHAAPADVRSVVEALRRDPAPLVAALRTTPTTFVQGDWKMGNLGSWPDGRTILLDWATPGEGVACHELGWYLALNAARLPQSKEDAIAEFRAALERHGVATAGWWNAQLSLSLLGMLVIFGWEKALGDAAELGWWCDRARDGMAFL